MAQSPGDQVSELEVEDKSWFFGSKKRMINVKLSPIYTDYANIAVFYSCYETYFNWIASANRIGYILIRDRTFDSLNQFVNAVTRLAALGIDNLNDIKFIPNGLSCTN